MAPPADAFSDPVKQWIRRSFTESVVLVEMRPKCAQAVKARWDLAFPIPHGDVASNAERQVESSFFLRATGFVVKVEDDITYVLSCAHLVSNLFSQNAPISAAQIEALYDTFILCDHCEQLFLLQREYNPHLQRDYTPALVSEIDHRTGLMLLEIARVDLQARCGHRHRAIPVAENSPSPLVDVVMLSWPWEGNRTAVAGLTSHARRAHNYFSEDHDHGYEMELSGVDITSDRASSGSPLIGGAGRFVGVLQSGNTTFSYFISLDDVRITMVEWGLLG